MHSPRKRSHREAQQDFTEHVRCPIPHIRTSLTCLRPETHVPSKMWSTQTVKMAWRSYDRPMPGTIFRLPDILSLVRGMTYTILPDGRHLRVPSMNRMDVRAKSDGHAEDQGHDIMQALGDILAGKKPVAGRARHNRRGVAQGNRINPQDNMRGPPARIEGLQQAAIGVAE